MKTYQLKIESMIKVQAESKAQAYEMIGKVVESHHSVEFVSISLHMLSDAKEE